MDYCKNKIKMCLPSVNEFYSTFICTFTTPLCTSLKTVLFITLIHYRLFYSASDPSSVDVRAASSASYQPVGVITLINYCDKLFAVNILLSRSVLMVFACTDRSTCKTRRAALAFDNVYCESAFLSRVCYAISPAHSLLSIELWNGTVCLIFLVTNSDISVICLYSLLKQPRLRHILHIFNKLGGIKKKS